MMNFIGTIASKIANPIIDIITISACCNQGKNKFNATKIDRKLHEEG